VSEHRHRLNKVTVGAARVHRQLSPQAL